jgi:hypothetical protein
MHRAGHAGYDGLQAGHKPGGTNRGGSGSPCKGRKADANGTISNGKIQVPTIMLKPVLVTKNNIKTTVVKDGFQTLKSINQGLSKEQQIN